MPVSDATNPEQAAMTADAPMASTWHLLDFIPHQRRLDDDELEQLERKLCACSSCRQDREAG